MDTTTEFQTSTTINDSPSASPYPSPAHKSPKKIGPIVGGVVAAIVVAIIAVAMIVPCARRRQKRLRVTGDGYGGHRVLKKAADVEATEPMMNGSWRDHSRISEEDRMRSISSGTTAVQPGYIESLPVPKFPLLQPVKEGVVMNESAVYQNYPSATYFPQPPPMPATWAGRQSAKTTLPRFPSLDKLWPLTSAFRTSIYSSPSTKTKSSGASSAPSKGSRRRPSTGRGRSTEEKQINPEALTSPTVLGQELGFGRGRTAMDKEIKHVTPPTTIAYQTAPMHRGFSLKDTATTTRHASSSKTPIQPPQPSYSASPENAPRRRASADGSEHRHQRRKKSNDSPHRTRSHNQPHAARHHRHNSTENPVRAAHRSKSRSRSRTDNEITKKTRPDARKIHPAQPQVVYNYNKQPFQSL